MAVTQEVEQTSTNHRVGGLSTCRSVKTLNPKLLPMVRQRLALVLDAINVCVNERQIEMHFG